MEFYIQDKGVKLGEVPMGTAGRHVWKDLKTINGAIRRAKNLKSGPFQLYTFTNFFDINSFTLVYKQK